MIPAYRAVPAVATRMEWGIGMAMHEIVAAEGHVPGLPSVSEQQAKFDHEHRARCVVARGLERGDAPQDIGKKSRVPLADVRRIIADFEAGAERPKLSREYGKRPRA